MTRGGRRDKAWELLGGEVIDVDLRPPEPWPLEVFTVAPEREWASYGHHDAAPFVDAVREEAGAEVAADLDPVDVDHLWVAMDGVIPRGWEPVSDAAPESVPLTRIRRRRSDQAP